MRWYAFDPSKGRPGIEHMDKVLLVETHFDGVTLAFWNGHDFVDGDSGKAVEHDDVFGWAVAPRMLRPRIRVDCDRCRAENEALRKAYERGARHDEGKVVADAVVTYCSCELRDRAWNPNTRYCRNCGHAFLADQLSTKNSGAGQ